MCEKCKKQKKVKDKCTKCRIRYSHKMKAKPNTVKLKRVPMYTLSARKPGVNVLGKYVH